MRKNALIISLIFIVPLFSYFMLTRADASNTDKNIPTTLNKPKVIKFTSLMCIDCKKMNTVFKEVFPQYNNKIAIVEVNVQSDNDITRKQIEKYNVTLVPTMIFVNADGTKSKKVEGFIDKTEFENNLKAILND